MNLQLSPDYIEEQSDSIKAKIKYLQAYATLVSRIKSRTDDFVKSNYDGLSDQIKIVTVLHDKLKHQLHHLI